MFIPLPCALCVHGQEGACALKLSIDEAARVVICKSYAKR